MRRKHSDREQEEVKDVKSSCLGRPMVEDYDKMSGINHTKKGIKIGQYLWNDLKTSVATARINSIERKVSNFLAAINDQAEAGRQNMLAGIKTTKQNARKFKLAVVDMLNCDW